MTDNEDVDITATSAGDQNEDEDYADEVDEDDEGEDGDIDYEEDDEEDDAEHDDGFGDYHSINFDWFNTTDDDFNVFNDSNSEDDEYFPS